MGDVPLFPELFISLSIVLRLWLLRLPRQQVVFARWTFSWFRCASDTRGRQPGRLWGDAGSCFNSAPADNFCTINQAFGFFQIHSGGVAIRIANEASQALKVTELLCRVSDQRGKKPLTTRSHFQMSTPKFSMGNNSDSGNSTSTRKPPE